MSEPEQQAEGCQWMTRRCPGCHSDASRPIWQKGKLTVVGCEVCDLYYANPVEAELASGKFYDRLGVPFYLSPEKLESDYAPVRFKREIGLFRRWCDGGRVLDVGCSTGAFLYKLKNLSGYEGVGTDVTGPALDYAESKGVTVIRESFLSHDFGAERFDAVTFWAVVEHLTDPLPFLSKATELLHEGGHLFILVPNRTSLATRILGARYRYIMPDHVNYFSPKTLREFVAKRPELEIVARTTTHFNPVVILQDLRRRDERVPDKDRAQLLKRTTRLKQAIWLRPIRWLYDGVERILSYLNLADNLVIVARKRRSSSARN